MTKDRNQPGADPSTIMVGGRAWRGIGNHMLGEKTVPWIAPQLAHHRIDIKARPGEGARKFAERLYTEVCDSALVFPVLGSFMIPDELSDEQWSPELAIHTGRFLGRVCDEHDREVVLWLLIAWTLAQAGILK